VTVRRTSVTGTVVSGATISAIHAAGTGCTAGETLTTTTTNAAGQLRLALPYGTWTIRAVSGTRNGTATVTLDPASTTVPALTVVIP
jgi:hypothetical protein